MLTFLFVRPIILIRRITSRLIVMASPVEKKMNRNVVRIHPDKSVRYAGQILKAVDIGCLIVVDGSDKIEGIITERDIVQKVVANGLDPDSTKVRDVMSKNVITIEKKQTVDEAKELMEKKRIKKLPIIDKGKLIGILTSTDMIQ